MIGWTLKRRVSKQLTMSTTDDRIPRMRINLVTRPWMSDMYGYIWVYGIWVYLGFVALFGFFASRLFVQHDSSSSNNRLVIYIFIS